MTRSEHPDKTKTPPKRQHLFVIMATAAITLIAIAAWQTFGSVPEAALAAAGLALVVASSAYGLHLAKNASLAPTQDTLRSRLPADLAQIYDRVRDGIVIFDIGNDLTFANLSARALLLRDDDGDPIQRLLELFPDIERVEPGREITFRIDETDEAGNHMCLQCRVNSIRNQSTTAFYCVLYDATEFQRLTRARADFISSVNHELRTPLTSLGGALSMLMAKEVPNRDAAEHKLLTMAKRNADRLLILVNDILTVQAIDQNGLSVSCAPEQVSELLHDALMMNQSYADGYGIALTLEAPETDAQIEADGTRFQQIMSNLISNAVKYSPKGGTVRVGARVDGGQVTFHVADQGPGILPQFHDKIFSRFAGPLQPAELQATGTGLGLAITHELTRRQNGDLRFETHTAQDPAADGTTGTTFLATFPTLADATGTTTSEESAA